MHTTLPSSKHHSSKGRTHQPLLWETDAETELVAEEVCWGGEGVIPGKIKGKRSRVGKRKPSDYNAHLTEVAWKDSGKD